MAGVSSGEGSGGRGGKRSVDREINMAPFIDLLMVAISFLLITAVWTASGRLATSTQTPGEKGKEVPKEATVLHVRVDDGAKNARLEWQTGTKTEDVASVSLAGGDKQLAEAVTKAFAVGLARGTLVADPVAKGTPNQAVLHVPPALPMGDVARVIDVIYTPKAGKAPAFHVTFSST